MGASLAVQWIRFLLTMQGTWVQSLVREDPACLRATKETRTPRAHAAQQKKPPQRETHATQLEKETERPAHSSGDQRSQR